jgi:hypothetical protein
MCCKEKHATLLVLPAHRGADSDLKVPLFFLLICCSLLASFGFVIASVNQYSHLGLTPVFVFLVFITFFR